MCIRDRPKDESRLLMNPIEQAMFFARLGVEKALRINHVADFRMSMRAYEAVKKRVSASLPKGQWVSSYEALMGTLLHALALADGTSDVRVRAVINMRGRSSLVPKDYFGCAIAAPAFTFKRPDSPTDTAAALHDSLRATLEDTRALDAFHAVPERAGLHANYMLKSTRHVGLKQWYDCVSRGTPLLNSWLAYDFLDLDFGCGARPSGMRVPSSFRFTRQIWAAALSAEELCVRVELEPSTMARFKAICRTLVPELREDGGASQAKL